jgi:predicted dehydrogenase
MADMADRVRVGVIGCGGIARHHLGAYRTIKDMEIVGAADLNPAALDSIAKDFAVGERFTDAEAMLEKVRPDLAVVMVPYPAHGKVVEMVASHKVHVLCQKPMAGTMAEVDRMIAACDKAGVMFGINENYRYLKPFALAKEVLAAGRIGDPLVLHYEEVLFWKDIPRMYATLNPFYCIEMGPHYFDSICWLTGRKARRVFGTVRRFPMVPSAGDNAFYAHVELEGGVIARVDDVVAMPGRNVRDHVYIDGTKGSIAIYASEGEFAVYDAQSARWASTSLGGRNTYWGESFRGPMEDFITAFRAGRDAPLPGREYRHVMEIAFAVYENRTDEL